MHGGNGKLALVQLLGEPVDLAAGRTEDDGLGDGDCLVEIAKSVKLPVLLLDGNVWKTLVITPQYRKLTHKIGGYPRA